MQVAESTIWLTGASSGIGEALAYALDQAGAHLILSARRADALEAVRTRCTRPDAHTIVPLDLADPASIASAAATVGEHTHPLDLLINNGGISQRDLAQDTTLDVDRRIMEVNYFGTIALTKAVLPGMLARKRGHFVAISSVVGYVGAPYRSAYAASKHALHGFFESLRAEVADQGIGVTIVCPGFIHTNISKNALKGDGRAHNEMDANQSSGLSAEACAERIVAAIKKDKAELIVGGTETMGIYLRRFAPNVLRGILRKRVQKGY